MINHLRRLLKLQKPILFIILFATIILLYPLTKLRSDNSMEVWISKHDIEYIKYKEFKKKFKVEDFILLAVEGFDYKNTADNDTLNKIVSAIKNIDGISNVHHINDLSSIDNPFIINAYKSAFLSDDNRIYGIWISIKNESSASSQKTAYIIESITKLIKSYNDKKYYIAGPPVLNNEMNITSIEQSMIFLPLVVILSCTTLLILFRNFKVLLIAVIIAFICQIWAHAIISLTGHTMNMIISALSPLLWVISISAIVYMSNAVLSSNDGDVAKAIASVFKPCSLTIVTTAIGFLSLAVSHIEPVKYMGLFSFISLFVTLFLTIVLCPILLNMFKVIRSSSKDGAVALQDIFSNFKDSLLLTSAKFHSGKIIIAAIIITALSIFYISKIETETDNLSFFDKDSKIKKDYNYIGNKLTGHSPIDVIIKGNNKSWFKDINHLYDIDKIIRSILKIEGVKDVIEMNQLMKVIDDVDEVNAVLKDEIKRYFNNDFSEMRLIVLTDYVGTTSTIALTNKIRKTIDNLLTTSSSDEIDKKMFKGYTYYITGAIPLLSKMQDELLASQIKSFLAAFVLITLTFVYLFKNIPMALIAMTTNLFPIVIALGVMGFFHIPLNVATIMIASIAIGISVDDTIHFTVTFNDYFKEIKEPFRSIKKTFEKIGIPIIFTTIINIIGFGVLALSIFSPHKYFSLLMMLTFFSALISNLFLLPAILMKSRFL